MESLNQTRNASAMMADDRALRWQIFAAALAVRVLYILLAHTFRVRPSEDHFEFGWEMGRIGRALATGYGYADPFIGHTGPTAWTPPLYTLLVGGVFKVFGVYSKLSAFVLLAVNSLFSAWTAVLCYEIALRCFGRRCAVWSGWLWALYPAAMQYAVRWIWEMSASAAVLAAILVLMLRLRGVGEYERPRQTWQQWAVFGLLWGVMALLNPSPLLLLPVAALYALAAPGWTPRRLGYAALAGVMFVAMLAPWTARNWMVFHRLIPVRDNFGAENFVGNNDATVGFPWVARYELVTDAQRAEYVRLGEAEWSAKLGRRADVWIHSHPNRFAALTVKRAYMYWAGVPKSVEEAGMLEYFRLASFQFLSLCGLFGVALAVRNRAPAALLFAAAFLLLPLAYYAVTVQARFRHLLEPLICVLGVYLFQQAQPRRKT